VLTTFGEALHERISARPVVGAGPAGERFGAISKQEADMDVQLANIQPDIGKIWH